KTRLAIQLATDLIDAFPGGVWWVELAALTNEAFVPQTIAQALGVRESPGESVAEALLSYVSARQLLLVLDNCEHLLGACAHWTNTLLRASPALKLLVTSREPLRVSGETLWHIPTLSVPDSAEALQTPMQFESVRLFVERASAVRSDFVLSAQNARLIVHICGRLDGMPLAIELATARVNSLSLEQIATRLDDRFGLLTGGSRTALPRQQTLRATMDWS